MDYQQSNRPTNWLPWAIVGTIVGFFTSCISAIFGIIGIVQANKANNFYAMGNYEAGDAANSTAKIMTIISLVLIGISIIGGIIFLCVSGISYTAAIQQAVQSIQ